MLAHVKPKRASPTTHTRMQDEWEVMTATTGAEVKGSGCMRHNLPVNAIDPRSDEKKTKNAVDGGV